MAYYKYKYYKKQIYSGDTWVDVEPITLTLSGSPIGVFDDYQSCMDYTPIPVGLKYRANYSNGETYFVECDYTVEPDILTSATTRPIGNQYQYSAITSVVIGDCVTGVTGNAFKDCVSLSSVTISDNVEYFGDSIFKGCISLRKLELGTHVTRLCLDMANDCTNLTNITINSTTIPEIWRSRTDAPGYIANRNCIIYVPSNMYSTYIYYQENESDYHWDWVANEIMPISGNLSKFKATYSDETTYSAACDSSATLTQSEVRPSGYEYSAMTNAVIGDCVTSIGNNAFYGCSGLTSITIPSGVTSVGGGSFQYCSGLTSVTIPNSVTTIGNYAFSNCYGLTSVTIDNSVTSIGNSAFYQCTGLTSINIPSGVTSIGEYTFSGCTSLTSVTIPDNVTSIGNSAFDGCSNLTSVTIPSSVTSIGDYTFQDCSSLTSVTIPNSVTSIGISAFRYCRSLTSITVEATTPPTLSRSAFSFSNNCPIYVPSASVETYKSASVWSTYADRIQAIP